MPARASAKPEESSVPTVVALAVVMTVVTMVAAMASPQSSHSKLGIQQSTMSTSKFTSFDGLSHARNVV